MVRRRTLFLLLAVTVLGITLGPRPTAHAAQQPGTLIEVSLSERYSAEAVREISATLFEPYGVPEAYFGVDAYWVRYRSTDFDGSEAVIQGQLFVPRYRESAERPLLVFGAGTTGIAERCSPVLEVPLVNRWGWYLANMLAYAGKGFITIFPEYLGFGDPDTPQRYFGKVAEAHVMLDAIRAVYNFFDDESYQDAYRVRPSRAVFAAGYSQGGHAAHAAADLRPDYAPEVPLTGLIGFGQTNDVATLMREMAYYTPYIIYSYAEMYGYDEIDPADYLQSRWLPTFEDDIYRFCVEEFQYYYPTDGKELYTPEFYAALHEDRLDSLFPAMARRLEENRAGYSGHGLPSLVLQGEHDIIITTPEQDRFVAVLRARNSAVEYVVMPRARHRDTRPVGFQRSVDWMEALARGDEAPNTCPGR